MNNHPTYSLDQILDSINEMRTEMRWLSGSDSNWDPDTEFWQEPADKWFEDCEFDPRYQDED